MSDLYFDCRLGRNDEGAHEAERQGTEHYYFHGYDDKLEYERAACGLPARR